MRRKKSIGKASGRTPALSTAEARVRWLLKEKWKDNRADMAKEVGLTYTGLVKVVTGQQRPGRRLLEKIVRNGGVDANWLLAGLGEPFSAASALPVAEKPLPGSPLDRADLLLPKTVSALSDWFRPTRYWLRVAPTEGLVKDIPLKIKPGDLLLMESDPKAFPAVEQWHSELCVVREDGKNGPQVQLAEATYRQASDDEGPAHLRARYFRGNKIVERTIFDQHPDGKITARKEFLEKVEQPEGRQKGRLLRSLNTEAWESQVELDNVVAICLLTVRQHWPTLRAPVSEKR